MNAAGIDARLHIGIAGPIATADIAPWLDSTRGLPRGYDGAPLLATLIGELLSRGHRVSAFTLSSDMPLRRDAIAVARGPGLTLHLAPMRPRAWPFNGWRPGRIVDLYRFERAGLTAAMKAARPQLVHAHWSYEFAWSAIASGLPHVVTCHDSPVLVARLQRGGWRYSGYRWLRAAMAHHVMGRARVVTAVSPYMAEAVRSWCRAPIDVVPNPIGRAAFEVPRPARGDGDLRVLMVCNGFGPRKNAEAGMRAFANFSRQHPTAELQLLGDDFGPGEAAQAWWRASGLRGRVRFSGCTDHRGVIAAMAASDVLLHPALEESFGAVLAEAMAVGLPVVAGARSGAVPWVVADAGLLVDITDPDAMAGALARIAAAPEDATAMAQRARAMVLRRFSVASVADRYTAIYHRCLHPAPTGAGTHVSSAQEA